MKKFIKIIIIFMAVLLILNNFIIEPLYDGVIFLRQKIFDNLNHNLNMLSKDLDSYNIRFLSKDLIFIYPYLLNMIILNLEIFIAVLRSLYMNISYLRRKIYIENSFIKVKYMDKLLYYIEDWKGKDRIVSLDLEDDLGRLVF